MAVILGQIESYPEGPCLHTYHVEYCLHIYHRVLPMLLLTVSSFTFCSLVYQELVFVQSYRMVIISFFFSAWDFRFPSTTFFKDTFPSSLWFWYLYQILSCWSSMHPCLGVWFCDIGRDTPFNAIPYCFNKYGSAMYLKSWNENPSNTVPFYQDFWLFVIIYNYKCI